MSDTKPSKKRIPRPGDVIRITKSSWIDTWTRGEEHIVTKVSHNGGSLSYATGSVAWIPLVDCEYVRRATDKEYIRALREALD